jgi:hypothetical protein
LADDVVESHGFAQIETRAFGRETKWRVHKTAADSTALFDKNWWRKTPYIWRVGKTALFEGFCVEGEGKAKV